MKFYEHGVRKLHLEITNRCNAKCPICIRTRHNGNNRIPKEISVQDFKTFFPKSFLENLKILQFCGNYGDPIVARDLIDIHEYVLLLNPRIQFMISTNGGARSDLFWQKLAQFYQRSGTNSHVVFCIDGLQDTNNIYRQNVNWDTLIRNVTTFNDAGGNSHWRFIPFKHNQHQINQAEDLSKDIGCSVFKMKISGRLAKHAGGSFTFLHNNKEFILEDPTIFDVRVRLKNVNDTAIMCRSQLLGELYVDAHGTVYPCCWLATNRTHQNMFENSLYFNSLDKISRNKFFTCDIQYQFMDKYVICDEHCGPGVIRTAHIYLENGQYSVATPWNLEVIHHANQKTSGGIDG